MRLVNMNLPREGTPNCVLIKEALSLQIWETGSWRHPQNPMWTMMTHQNNA